jgi:hemoglobin-like flavoprotein
MTPEQVALVRDGFRQVAPYGDAVAMLFYGRLFALDPTLKRLFKDDMREQRRKLIAALALAVGALDRPETVVPALRALGRRHAAYGVRPEHFATVGEALLGTLEDGLGSAFTEEVRAAWAACYELVATVVREGMAEAERRGAAGVAEQAA